MPITLIPTISTEHLAKKMSKHGEFKVFFPGKNRQKKALP